MRLALENIRWKKMKLSNLYIVSLVVTLTILLIKRSELLIKTSLFDKNSLEVLREQTVDSGRLFFVVLKSRLAMIASIFLLATTVLGNTYIYMCVVWYGAASGLFLTIVLLRYGMKGVLLLWAGLFPHYLVYVPAVILSMRINRDRREVDGRFCMQFVMISFVVITGCLLECYVNPYVITKILRNF